MTWPPCEHEPEVLEAIHAGRLEEWRAHLAECASCAGLVVVLRSMQAESDQAAAEVRLPSAGQVWFRSQLRARREATEEALKPASVAEKVAYASVLAGLIAALAWEWPRFGKWFSNMDLFAPLAGYRFEGLLPGFLSLQSGFALGIGTALFCLILFVVYAALADR
jgi:hypothetical protein